ncbi:MAG TPA: glycosyltransferase [Thermoplasmata archaeon]
MTRVIMIGPVGEHGGVSSHTKGLVRALGGQGIETFCYDISGELANIRTRTTWHAKLFRRIIGQTLTILNKRSDIDLIHTQASGGTMGFLPAVISAILGAIVNVPTVVTFHYGRAAEFVSKHRDLLLFVVKCSSAFILISDSQREVLAKSLPHVSHRIQVIGNGFDTSLFKPMNSSACRERVDVPQSSKLACCVANMVAVKGHRYLIRAAEIISAGNPNFLLVLVGDGPLRESLEKETQERKIGSCIRFVGAQPNELIPTWINASDCVVLASLNEGSPMVMFETMGCGKPLVATKVGGLPEVVLSERFGILVPPADPEVLASAIVRSFETRWDASYIRSNSLQYGWDSIASKVALIYRESMNQHLEEHSS